MLFCTFFGHRDAPNTIEPILRSALVRLIENEGVENFYVGNEGRFDRLVINVLKKLREAYPHIKCTVVLAYMPQKKATEKEELPTILADGCELAPPKFAIDRRNRWMLQKSAYVVTYVTHITGGAAKFKNMAVRTGKTVIELSD